ncbi:RidA family protein [Clostridium sp. AM58-1XD]|uniref:RidA family protein n=1 Tax=Clostridium sp. AM58-1XD TaxID=2292307 RepID=UPI000E4F6C90|nr:RidA family protein [Clostridium sp. AM58-1XD]RGY98680.1 RidA family protein [Clostridium sp. AM58-1XD]
MPDINHLLNELGIVLPEQPEGTGVFNHVTPFGDHLIYVAGCGPEINGELKYKGRVGVEVTMDQARECAADCVKNILCALKIYTGDLNKVKKFVKMNAYICCNHDFYYQPEVADTATELLASLFGEKIGIPARTSIGVSALPYGFPVEIEVIVELY